MGASVSLAFGQATKASRTLEFRRVEAEADDLAMGETLVRLHAIRSNGKLTSAVRRAADKAYRDLTKPSAEKAATDAGRPARDLPREQRTAAAKSATADALGTGWTVLASAEYGTVQASRDDGRASLGFALGADAPDEAYLTVRVRRPADDGEFCAMLSRLAEALGGRSG